MDHLVEELREKQVQKAIKKDKALNLRKARGQKFRGGRGMEESAGAASAAAEVHVPSEDLLEIIDLREEARRKKAMEETRKAAKIEDSNQVEKQTTITTDDSCGGGSGKTKLDTKPQVGRPPFFSVSLDCGNLSLKQIHHLASRQHSSNRSGRSAR
jgi:hypothetical protein